MRELEIMKTTPSKVNYVTEIRQIFIDARAKAHAAINYVLE
jgi:hypothetical protein